MEPISNMGTYEILSETGVDSGVYYEVKLNASNGAEETQKYFVSTDQVKEDVLEAAADHWDNQ